MKDGENRVAVVWVENREDGCNKVNSIRHYGRKAPPPCHRVARARRLFSSVKSIRAPQNGRLVGLGEVDGACAHERAANARGEAS